MRKTIFAGILILAAFKSFSQTDSSEAKIMASQDSAANLQLHALHPTKVFYSQKLINSNTVEVLPKGIMEFKVIHNFDDVAGSNGGVKTFFGMDNVADVKIAFQIGLSSKLNIVAARTRGGDNDPIQQLWEGGIKYQFLQQIDNDKNHPISLTAYVNTVISTMPANTTPDEPNSFATYSDRWSQLVQLMIARKFGQVSVQLTPSFVYAEYVQPGDQNGLFSLGGALRLPVSKKVVLISDYFHTFRNEESKNLYASEDIQFYDALGVGVEILTAGHIFHLNFTNATNILENRFIPNTSTSWTKGQFRWGFTIARNFVLFRDKGKVPSW